MNLQLEIEKARAEEARLVEEKRRAYDRDPGNLGLAHIVFNAFGYHHVFHQWMQARERRIALERQQEAAACLT